ncbi:hypothetical protein DASC09_011290 [Saccharomycopsis crataegensis]|uniref:Extradiol ring-cleavage dioxygenase class III enzyme subunit B domain-containing protein n=1 Tax=Saccharomycopsis crataegensis TaxID=43959 RepID=A0AAV5QGF0_9ASCO|nr:hypothetical protein DASC09_011290 [Saccharomycopsis crataegensis]
MFGSSSLKSLLIISGVVLTLSYLFNTNFFTKFTKTAYPLAHNSSFIDQSSSTVSSIVNSTMTSVPPVYFISHGGPTFMFNDDFGGNTGCFQAIKRIGKDIKNKIKPKYIIIITGHWESRSSDLFEVGVPDLLTSSSVDEKGGESSMGRRIARNNAHYQKIDPNEHSLVYDFFGFPEKMYEQRFHVKGSSEIANKIQKQLTKDGLNAKTTSRGIDHGVWVPLKAGLSDGNIITDSGEWDIDCPLIQVSLAKSEDFDVHYKLGQSLAKFRDEGALIITSGSSVHNLRDIGYAMSSGKKALPYVTEFNSKLSEIVTKKSGVAALEAFNLLKKQDRALLYKAHPTLDHIMPIVVGVGASNAALAEELYTDASLSLGWNLYQWN